MGSDRHARRRRNREPGLTMKSNGSLWLLLTALGVGLGAGGYYAFSRTDHSIATLSGHGTVVRCVAASPDGKLLATGADDGAIVLW
ncbi:MAG: hypothetical protein JNK93_06830, partial [Planctomycetia bacterium]|nr:hypothetical protein [Planctomycetia bacterium]